MISADKLGAGITVQWSPCYSNFLSTVGGGGDKLVMQRLSRNDDDMALATSAEKVSKRNAFMLEQVAEWVPNDGQAITCTRWYPFDRISDCQLKGKDPCDKFSVAVGNTQGKVSIVRLIPQSLKKNIPCFPTAYSMLDLYPKVPRSCNNISWNPHNSTHLACAYDRVRHDFGILIFDVGLAISAQSSLVMPPITTANNIMSPTNLNFNAGANDVVVGSPMNRSSMDPVEGNKALHRLASGEGVSSLDWIFEQGSMLIAGAGAGSRWLKIFDLRSRSAGAASTSIIAHVKVSSGVKVAANSHQSNIVATFSDYPGEPVKVWDTRKLSGTAPSPIASFRVSPLKNLRSIAAVSWCPFQSDVLATVLMDDDRVFLWDINSQQGIRGNHQSTPLAVHHTHSAITSISWQKSGLQPAIEERTTESKILQSCCLESLAYPCSLLLGMRGEEIEVTNPFEVAPIAISSTGHLAYACGKLMFESVILGHINYAGFEDVEQIMKKRAENGYGMHIRQNYCILTEELDAIGACICTNSENCNHQSLQSLLHAWDWVDRIEFLCGYENDNSVNQSNVHAKNQRLYAEKNSHSRSNASLACDDWPTFGLADSGIQTILQSESSSTDQQTESLQSVLFCPTFFSPARRHALLACGWLCSGEEKKAHGEISEKLLSMMENCEHQGHYGRSAAIAVWHGELRVAIQALHRGIDAMQQQEMSFSFNNVSDGESAKLDDQIKGFKELEHLFQLVAMCIAGFASYASDVSNRGYKTDKVIWRETCESLLSMPEMQQSGHVAYLRACCTFLVSIPIAQTVASHPSSPRTGLDNPPLSTPRSLSQRPILKGRKLGRSWFSQGNVSHPTPPDSDLPVAATADKRDSVSEEVGILCLDDTMFRRILEDYCLPLEDRMAFALKFLSRNQLEAFMNREACRYLAAGDLEGLLILGLSSSGIDYLQAFVDKGGDVQTAALLVSRVRGLNEFVFEDNTAYAKEWMASYRDLLNSWEMWKTRAIFDVNRAEIISRVESHRRKWFGQPERIPIQDQRVEKGEINSIVHPHLYVRCNFCNKALPLSMLQKQGNIGNTWLSRQKSILSCCPTCRKPLPKCYVCLQLLGCLNPYLESKRQQLKAKALAISARSMAPGGDSGGEAEEGGENYASMRFSEWLTWCHRCKHGGHAHHIMDWFNQHTECGVSGCSCCCLDITPPNSTSA